MRPFASPLTLRLGAVLAAAAILAACGGGGGGSSSAVSPSLPLATSTAATSRTSTPAASSSPTAAPPAGTAAATFSVVVPIGTTSSSARSARYIASNTRAISFTLVKTDAPGGGSTVPQIFALDATQPYCATQTAGLSCSLNVNAPIGNDVFVAATYSDAAATQKIGSGAVQLTVQANARNTASLSLGGPIANVVTIAYPAAGDYYTRLLANAPTPAPQTSGTPSPYATAGYQFYPSARLYVVGLDINNNAIVAPDTYSTPITLTVSNGSPSYGYYGSSAAREPRAGGPATPPPTSGPTATPTPTATPVPTPAATATPVPTPTPIAAIVTVTHRDGTTASTSSTNFSVNVTAPDDIVTVTPTTTTQSTTYYGSYYNTPVGFNITATINSVSVTRTYNIQPANCPNGFTGSPPVCVAPTVAATPTAAPTACPNGYGGTAPSCTMPQFFFSGGYPRLQTIAQYDAQGYYYVPTIQFLSTNDSAITVSLTDTSTVASAPQVWITDDSTSSCASFVATGINQLVTMGGSPGAYSGSFTLTPATGGAYGSCRLNAWAYPNDGTRLTVPINISINNVTGTIR